MHSLQEKFQITVPSKKEEGEGWASFESQRDVGATKEWCSSSAADVDYTVLNRMPPGMEIADQCNTEQLNMPMSLAGATDVSNHVTPKSVSAGFSRLEMKGTDDQYTGEHVDHFYGDAGGFVERNNYLDRE